MSSSWCLLEKLCLHLPQYSMTLRNLRENPSRLTRQIYYELSSRYVSFIRKDCYLRLYQSFDLYGKGMTSIAFIHHLFKGISSSRLQNLVKLLYREYLRTTTESESKYFFREIFQAIFLSCIVLQYTEGLDGLLSTGIYCLEIHEFMEDIPAETEQKIHFLNVDTSLRGEHPKTLWECWSYYLSESSTMFHSGYPIRLAIVPYYFHTDIFRMLLQHGAMNSYFAFIEQDSTTSTPEKPSSELIIRSHINLILYDFEREILSQKWKHLPPSSSSTSGNVIMEHFYRFLSKEDFAILRIRYF